MKKNMIITGAVILSILIVCIGVYIYLQYENAKIIEDYEVSTKSFKTQIIDNQLIHTVYENNGTMTKEVFIYTYENDKLVEYKDIKYFQSKSLAKNVYENFQSHNNTPNLKLDKNVLTYTLNDEKIKDYQYYNLTKLETQEKLMENSKKIEYKLIQ